MGIQSPGFRVEPGMTRVFQSLQFGIIFAKLEAGMKKIVVWTIFYLVTLLLIGVLWGLFYPAASVLIKLAQSQKRGVSILIPLSFLLLSFLYAFLQARREGKRERWVAAYGWLSGNCALVVILLYLYLKQMTGG